MSGRTDFIVTALVLFSVACAAASGACELARAGGEVHLMLCAVYSILAALFVLVYARGRR